MLAVSLSDPKMRPQATFSKYWHYSVNELGCEDMAAQISLIDTVKRQELRQTVLVPNAEREPRISQELSGNAFSSPDMGFRRRQAFHLPGWPDADTAPDILADFHTVEA